MFKARLKEILIVVFLLIVAAVLITGGCAADLRCRTTVFDAQISDTAQTSLVSGHRAARD